MCYKSILTSWTEEMSQGVKETVPACVAYKQTSVPAFCTLSEELHQKLFAYIRGVVVIFDEFLARFKIIYSS
jgi:hypothetical protein